MMMATSSSTIPTSSQRWYQLAWLHTLLFFFLFAIFSTTLVVSVSSTTEVPYADHCASIVPESHPTIPDLIFPLRQLNGHYSGGNIIQGQNLSEFSPNTPKPLMFSTTRHVYRTNVDGVYKVEANMIFHRSDQYYIFGTSTRGQSLYSQSPPRGYHPYRSSWSFKLQGYWSESSGKLCMVGSGFGGHSKEGTMLDLKAVLKLNYVKNSSIVTSLVSGTFESLSPTTDHHNYFEPISILAFPQMDHYKYTLVSEEFDNECSGGIDIPQNSSLGLDICSMLSRPVNGYELEYATECNSSQNCTPFSGGIGYLPRVMLLNMIQCSDDKQKLRLLFEFPNSSHVEYYRPFNPNTTLVAEGSWDWKKNRLCVVACRILKTSDSLANASVGDCSIRLSLRFPATRSIRNSSSTVGQIWSNKTATDSGYFDRIMFGSYENSMVGVRGLKYQYTEIDRVSKSSCRTKPVKNKGGRSYPNGNSYEIGFDMSVKNSKGNIAWGYATPFSVGDQFYERYVVALSSSGGNDSAVEASTIYRTSPLNISYRMSFTLISGVKWGGGMPSFNLSSRRRVQISAEGIYDAGTGSLCMVGCRNLNSNIRKSSNESMDCEIFISVQFPPLNSKNGGYIKGSIDSTRKKSDPLYFEHLDLSSTAFYSVQAERSIWRMDLEIIMVLISNTLACVFVGLQLFYVRNHPDVLPFISLVMLVVLTLGHMIPLVLNFEALFSESRNRQNALLGSGGWLEVNEVIVRVVTMVAFLLQFRLLQLTWSSRLGDGNQKSSWVAEKKALFVSSPLYLAGGLIALYVNLKKTKYGALVLSSRLTGYHQHSLWGGLRSYAGLVLDGFLFPQILFNIFRGSRENALSHSFYIGTTFVRLLPHAYDLYRAHNYARHYLDGSYIYANPGADFYSTAWDVIIPCGGLLFALIIYLQQRLGNRCMLPQRFREFEEYEKVPVVSGE